MESQTKEIIKKQLAILPKELTSLLTSDAIENAAAAVGDIYELAPEQVHALALEIYVTLLGLEFISTFPERVKTEVGCTDERREDILDSLAAMLFSAELLRILNEVERVGSAAEGEDKQTAPATKAPIPPAPKPGITANPTPVPVASDKTVGIKERPQAPVPTGKMVGLKKDEVESTIKGMRTMRGDINRLRGPEGEEATEDKDAQPQGDFKKPFKGS